MRISNIELRKTNTFGAEPYEYHEIVKWNDDHCFTLAIFDKPREGVELRFVGDRPFQLDSDEQEIFWEIAKYAQNVLQAEFDLKEKFS